MANKTVKEILDEYDFRLSGTPKHWEKTDERKAIDAEVSRHN